MKHEDMISILEAMHHYVPTISTVEKVQVLGGPIENVCYKLSIELGSK